MENRIIKNHTKALKILQGTIKREKIPHAFLFIGDSYLGKTSTAISYAKALNCMNSKFLIENCDICSACVKIGKGIHPDLKIISPEKDTITVNMIREIEEFISLKPLESKYKIVIVREAHKMNLASANAFLKTLEEPPVHTVIILICNNIQSLPEPLVSRCFKINFTPLSKDIIEQLIPDSENKELIIKLIMGRPGLYLTKDILKEVKWFGDTVGDNIKKAPWKDNEEVKLWIDFFCIVLRDALREKITGENDNIMPLKISIRENVTIENIINLYDKLMEIRKNIDLNLNKAIVWNFTEKIIRGVINV